MEDNKSLSATAAPAKGPSSIEKEPSTADTLYEVAVKISTAAVLINHAALVIQKLASRKLSGEQTIQPSRSLSIARGSQTDFTNTPN